MGSGLLRKARNRRTWRQASLLRPREVTRDIWTVVLSGVMACGVLMWFVSTTVTDLYRPDIAKLTDEARTLVRADLGYGVNPEPTERLIFVILCVLCPLFLFGWHYVLTPVVARLRTSLSDLLFYLVLLLAAAFLAVLIAGSSGSTNLNYFGASFLLSRRVAVLLPVVLIVAYLALKWVDFPIWIRRLIGSASLGAVITLIPGAIVLGSLFTYHNSSSVINDVNLNAVIYSVSQVMQGGFPLVDFTNQYGLYALILEPVFRIVGFSLLKFSMVMSFLIVLSYALAGIGVFLVFKSRPIAFLTVVLLIYYSYFDLRFVIGRDVYFAYYPIRLFFPCLFVALVGLLLARPRRWVLHALCLAAAVSVLWNLDSGVACFCALVVLLLAERFRTARATPSILALSRTAALPVAYLFAVVFALLAYAVLRTGQVPDLLGFIKYQGIFAGLGFYMLPMPPGHPWQLVIATYVLSFSLGIAGVVRGRPTPIGSFLIACSILGLGTFLYYQGRSHDNVLTAAWFPAFLCLGGLVEAFVSRKAPRTHGRTVARVILLGSVMLMSTTLCDFFVNRGAVIQMYSQGLDTLKMAVSGSQFEAQVRYLRSHFKSGERIFLMVDHKEGSLSAESNVGNAFRGPGSSELILKTDVERRREQLIENQKTKVVTDDVSTSAYLDILQAHYRRVDVDQCGLTTWVRT